jgi:riboflavin synthase
MFTGIIQCKTKITRIENKGVDKILHLQPFGSIDTYQTGESIAVNGVCLTLTDFNANGLTLYASKETLTLTNLSRLTTGSFVNIERALSLNDRLNGHFVTGHIDTQALLTQTNQVGSSKQLTFSIEKKYGEYLIPKGSIALDGISLTINQCTPTRFTVNIIPETLNRTTLSNWSLGYQTNVEIDTLSKHIYQYLNRGKSNSTLDKTFLINHGFE